MDDTKINLILKAQKGDKNALSKLIKEEQNNIYSTLYYLKKDEVDVSDIMQDVLIKLSKKIKQLKNPQYFKTWLNQIIINSYYDYLRKIKKKIKTVHLEKNDEEKEQEIPDDTPNPQDILLNLELDYIIKNSIEKLPMHYKIPITLREIQGLSYKEISDITKSTIGTVKSRIARARTIIKDKINNYTNI